ncbi:MAG: DUF4262 domain-containing protein [Methylococcales bacterium]
MTDKAFQITEDDIEAVLVNHNVWCTEDLIRQCLDTLDIQHLESVALKADVTLACHDIEEELCIQTDSVHENMALLLQKADFIPRGQSLKTPYSDRFVKEYQLNEKACGCPGLDESMKMVREAIMKYGWSCMGVVSGPLPGFTYSIGFATLSHPEIVITGIDHASSQSLLRAIYKRIKDEDLTLQDGDELNDIASMPVRFVKVSGRGKTNNIVQAYNYYKNWDFDVLQMIWPDTKGVFPGEDGFEDKFVSLQPLFFEK